MKLNLAELTNSFRWFV